MISDHAADEENVKAGKDDGSNFFKSYSITFFFQMCSFSEFNKIETYFFIFLYVHACIPWMKGALWQSLILNKNGLYNLRRTTTLLKTSEMWRRAELIKSVNKLQRSLELLSSSLSDP